MAEAKPQTEHGTCVIPKFSAPSILREIQYARYNCSACPLAARFAAIHFITLFNIL